MYTNIMLHLSSTFFFLKILRFENFFFTQTLLLCHNFFFLKKKLFLKNHRQNAHKILWNLQSHQSSIHVDYVTHKPQLYIAPLRILSSPFYAHIRTSVVEILFKLMQSKYKKHWIWYLLFWIKSLLRRLLKVSLNLAWIINFIIKLSIILKAPTFILGVQGQKDHFPLFKMHKWSFNFS